MPAPRRPRASGGRPRCHIITPISKAHPAFPGKAARILLNSYGIHGTLTTPQCVGFPHPPRSYPTGGGLRVHETRHEGLEEDYNKQGGNVVLQSLAPKFPEEPVNNVRSKVRAVGCGDSAS